MECKYCFGTELVESFDDQVLILTCEDCGESVEALDQPFSLGDGDAI